jgi:hypothetical protein
MRLIKNYSIVAVLMAVILGYSCSNIPDCRNEIPLNKLIVKFYDASDLTSSAIKFDSIKAANTDSIFYLEDSLSTYQLILDPSLNESTFMFYQGDKVQILAVSYARNVSIISEDCGPEILFSDILLDLETTSFDSAALTNNSLDQLISENIEIYF